MKANPRQVTGLLGAGVLLVFGCSDHTTAGNRVSDGSVVPDGSAGSDGRDCPGPPDPPGNPGSCRVWQCDPVAAPTCWACTIEPAVDGAECTDVANGVCVAGVCAAPADPADPGPYGSSASSASVVSGADSIPVTVYLPDGDGPFPVIILTHGFMLGPSLYVSYGRHLATWGYAAVLPELPGSMIAPRTHRELKEILIDVMDWVQDTAQEPSGPFGGKADPSRTGLAGHSLGGKISLLAATEDVRPLAVFGIDPVDAAGGMGGGDPVDYPSVTPELMPRISVPLVLLGETTNAAGTAMGQACAPSEDNFHQYFLHAASPALEIEVLGANHMSFLDDPDCGLACSVCPAGTDDPATTRRVTRRYLTAFFNLFVRGEQAGRAWLTGSAMAADVAAGLVRTDTKNGF